MQSSAPERTTLDCRGLQCPAPILRLSEAVRKRRAEGGTLTVLATDVDFPVDLDAWCRSTKARVVHLDRESDGVIRAEVRLPEPAVSDSVPSRSTLPLRRGAGADRPSETGDAEITVPSREVPPALVERRRRTSSVDSPRSGSSPARESVGRGMRPSAPVLVEETLDLRGMSLGAAVKTLNAAASATPCLLAKVRGDAAGFDNRLTAWAAAMDATIESLERHGSDITALVRFPPDAADPTPVAAPVRVAPAKALSSESMLLPPAATTQGARENKASLLVLRNDLEALLAALMVANASAAQGMRVEVYFAFWGIHLLRGRSTREARGERPGLLQRILLWLVPRGPKQRLGKLHLGGLGTRILLRLMRKHNILALDQLLASAVDQGVRFRVCSMSMTLMGIRECDIVDLPNIDFAGVTSFSEAAAHSTSSFVF